MSNENPDLLHLRFLGGSWLHHTAKSGNVPFAAKLLERGIPVNLPTARYGDGPLSDAVSGESPEMVTFLLQNGANPKVQPGQRAGAAADAPGPGSDDQGL